LLTRSWTDETILCQVAKAWWAFYNDGTNPKPDPNPRSHLMRNIPCSNGNWTDERSAMLK